MFSGPVGAALNDKRMSEMHSRIGTVEEIAFVGIKREKFRSFRLRREWMRVTRGVNPNAAIPGPTDPGQMLRFVDSSVSGPPSRKDFAA